MCRIKTEPVHEFEQARFMDIQIQSLLGRL